MRTFIWFAVTVPGASALRSRHSAGSSPSSWQNLSTWHSSAYRGCGVPWPRLGPQGGLLVKTRTPSNL